MRVVISSSVRVWNSALLVVSMLTLLPLGPCNGQRYRNQRGGRRNGTCQPKFLERCIKMADPLLGEPNNVFPTNIEDIDHACRIVFPQTWSKFIDCIDSFTATCLSSGERSGFNKAVGNSINSVHKMCTNEDYRGNYLRNADCIRRKAMNVQGSCKVYYDKLVNLIRGNSASGRELCCAHDSFKTCVIEETRSCPCEQSDCQDQTQTASHFAKVIMDNALGFLLKQCSSITTPSTPCNGYVAKRPRQEQPAAGTRAGGYDGKYFPSGNRGSFAADDSYPSGSHPRQSITNDPRTPKEAQEQQQQQPTVAAFDFDLEPTSIPDPDVNFGAPATNFRIHSSRTPPSGSPQSRERAPLLDERLDETPSVEAAKNKPQVWLADTQITDFDEFLSKTLKAGASTQSLDGSDPSRSSSEAAVPILGHVPAVLSILLYKLFQSNT